jgi:hypothetical protein
MDIQVAGSLGISTPLTTSIELRRSTEVAVLFHGSQLRVLPRVICVQQPCSNLGKYLETREKP